jgi:hypothetical protein
MLRKQELERRRVYERHFDDDQREHTRCSRRFTASLLRHCLTNGSTRRSTDEHGTGGNSNEHDTSKRRVVGVDRLRFEPRAVVVHAARAV